MRRYSFSELTRLAKCPPSGVLPQIDIESEAGNRGTEIHAFLQRANEVGREKALAECPASVRAYCELIDLSQLPVDARSFAAEVAFAVDLEKGTAREIGRGLNRNYGPLGEHEVAGTNDMVGVGPDIVYAGEAKSPHAIVPDAKDNDQVKAEALAAALAYNKPKALAELIRLRDDGTAYRDPLHLDAFDLSDILERMRAIDAGVRAAQVRHDAGEMPAVKLGAHCRHCKSRRFCPGQTGLLRGALSLTADDKRPVTLENAADMYHRIRAARKILGDLESEIYGIAVREPLDLGNGEVLGPVATKERQLDGKIVHEVLEAKWGREAADRAVTLDATFGRLHEVVMSKAAPRKGKAEEDALLALLEEKKGLTWKYDEEIKVHKPKRQLADKSEAA